MKNLILFERFNSSVFDINTLKFLDAWRTGSTHALMYLNRDVKDDLGKTLVKDEYVLYRGLKFSEEYMVKRLLGKDFDEVQIGDTLRYKPDGPTSWTYDKNVAEKFMNPFYNSFTGKMYTEGQLRKMDFAFSSIFAGILVKCTLDKVKVLADLNEAPKGSHENEIEVIVKAGVFDIEVIGKGIYQGDMVPSSNKGGTESRIKLINQDAAKRAKEGWPKEEA